MLFLFVHCLVINLVTGCVVKHSLEAQTYARLWRPTVAFTYLKVKSAKWLCLLQVVLVLRIWSCLHHCSLDSRSVQNLTPTYKLMMGRDLCLQAAGREVRSGHMVVAQRPAVCRQRWDAVVATLDTVEAGRWVVCGWWRWADAAGKQRHSLPVCIGASATDSVSSTVTMIDCLWRRLASISRRLSAIDLHRQPWKSSWPNDDMRISRRHGFQQ